MGYVTNDPKKGDEQQPGATGLVMDLGLMACPVCRRELPDWEPVCADCQASAVPRNQLGSMMPDIPAHLLADDADDRGDGDAGAQADGDPGGG